jgi:hypothetical protein
LRQKTDVIDADVIVSWMLQPVVGAVLDERERESCRDVGESEI